MGMYQGGYGNFAAKRAARHGKTKQYKAALEQKQNSNNSSVKQVENTKNTPTESNKSKERPYTGHPMIMSYPSAKGMEQITGDSLLIKCFKYIPPAISVDYKLETRYAPEGGGKYGGRVYEGGQEIKTTKNGKEVPKLFPKANSATFNNDGSSEKIRNTSPIFYVELPIPQDVNDSNSVTWSDDNMNIFQIAAVDAAAGVLGNTKESFENAKAILDAGIGRQIGSALNNEDGTGKDTARAITRAIAGKAIDALGANIRPNSVLGRSTGMILNSNLELLFSGVTLRTFPFSINFSPRSEAEANEVLSIIKALKSSMAAKKNASQGQGGIFLRAPDVFQLRYMHKGSDHPFLNRIKDCALTAMTVNYTNSGTYATYSDGQPVSIRMNLTFKELNPIYFEDYKDGVGGVGY